MQSNAPTSTATIGGLNIRVDKAPREARSATGQEAAEWPELVGLEVGRQVRLAGRTLLCRLMSFMHVK
jgi:hypothetical protein